MTDTDLEAAIAATASKKWRDLTFVGFDTETTGKYPIESEICEIAAVKWRNGEIIATFETLLKPSKPMGAEVIKIHGITNEMVATAPSVREKIGEFHEFIKDSIVVAHHAPFDLGFVAIEFEAAGLPLPLTPALCSSLLSRKLFPESENHRLQTLIKFFGLEQGVAHRALDDTKACLDVALRCLSRTGEESALSDAFSAQGGPITWQRFSMKAVSDSEIGAVLIEAIRKGLQVEMVYGSGSNPGAARIVSPIGLVRSLDGDFLVAMDESEKHRDPRSKRYFAERILSAKIVGQLSL